MPGKFSMVLLGDLVNSGPYASNIKLAEDLTGGESPPTNVSLYTDFLIDSADISLEGGGISVTVGEGATISVSFPGENGAYANQVFNKHENFSFEYESEGRVTITEGSISSTTVSWDISNDTAETVNFTLTSTSDFEDFTGWSITDECRDSEFSITWTSGEG